MPTPADARTPAELLAALVASDPTRPRVTWYDDAEGPTRGERIELSARVLANWTAKAANLLVDELDVEPGDVVVLALPPHWRALYWALAAWSAGAVVVVPAKGPAADHDVPTGARVLVVSAETAALAARAGAGSVVAVSLPALSRRWTEGPLPAGAVDEAAVLTGQGDVFVPFDEPDPDAPALRVGGQEWTAAGLVSAAREAASALPPQARALVTDGPAAAPTLLAPWTVDGSLVLVREPDPTLLDARLAAEQVTAR